MDDCLPLWKDAVAPSGIEHLGFIDQREGFLNVPARGKGAGADVEPRREAIYLALLARNVIAPREGGFGFLEPAADECGEPTSVPCLQLRKAFACGLRGSGDMQSGSLHSRIVAAQAADPSQLVLREQGAGAISSLLEEQMSLGARAFRLCQIARSPAQEIGKA